MVFLDKFAIRLKLRTIFALLAAQADIEQVRIEKKLYTLP
jgi:hypothetical protein